MYQEARMTQVFISYTRRGEYDRQYAEYLRGVLLQWGYQPWMDVHDIPSGAHWDDEIDKALKRSDVVIGLLSPASVESDNVKNEWAWALQKEKLQLVLLQPCDIPHRFIRIDYLDAHKDGPGAIGRLQANLARVKAGETIMRTTSGQFKLPAGVKLPTIGALRNNIAAQSRSGGISRGLLIGAGVGILAGIAVCVIIALLAANLISSSSGSSGSSGSNQGSNNVDQVAVARNFLLSMFNNDSFAASQNVCDRFRTTIRNQIDQLIAQASLQGGFTLTNLSCSQVESNAVQCNYWVTSAATLQTAPVTVTIPFENGQICVASIDEISQ
jgi:hypothetical protein